MVTGVNVDYHTAVLKMNMCHKKIFCFEFCVSKLLSKYLTVTRVVLITLCNNSLNGKDT